MVVEGRRYPPKQVLSLLTGLDRADFTTHQARRIFQRLGFAVSRRAAPADARPGEAAGGGGGPADAADAVEALRPFIGKWIAVRGDEVLVAADGPQEVVSWLARFGQTADSMFRVPDGEGAAGGLGPA